MQLDPVIIQLYIKQYVLASSVVLNTQNVSPTGDVMLNYITFYNPGQQNNELYELQRQLDQLFVGLQKAMT